MAKTKKTYRIEIEAKLDVEAFDEDSARKKIEKLLGVTKSVSADIAATGDVWTYSAVMVRDPRLSATT